MTRFSSLRWEVNRTLHRGPSKRRDSLPPYEPCFAAATRFVRQCGLACDAQLRVQPDTIDVDGNLITTALNRAGVFDLEKSAAQCVKWAHYLAPYFEDVLGVSVWPTIGQLWAADAPVFNPSWKELRQLAAEGMRAEYFRGRQGFNLHAWLTVETGEIIDLSLGPSWALLRDEHWQRFRRTVMWGRDPTAVHNHRYVPMAVGARYLEAVQARTPFPFLATNLAELHSVAVGLVFERS